MEKAAELLILLQIKTFVHGQYDIVKSFQIMSQRVNSQLCLCTTCETLTDYSKPTS